MTQINYFKLSNLSSVFWCRYLSLREFCFCLFHHLKEHLKHSLHHLSKLSSIYLNWWKDTKSEIFHPHSFDVICHAIIKNTGVYLAAYSTWNHKFLDPDEEGAGGVRHALRNFWVESEVALRSTTTEEGGRKCRKSALRNLWTLPDDFHLEWSFIHRVYLCVSLL